MKYDNILDITEDHSPITWLIISFILVLIAVLLFSPPSPQGIVIEGIEEKQNSTNSIDTHVLVDNNAPYPIPLHYISGEYVLSVNNTTVDRGKASISQTNNGPALNLQVELKDKQIMNLWTDYIENNETINVTATYKPKSYGPIPLTSGSLSYVKTVGNNSTPVSTMIEIPVASGTVGVHGNVMSKENLTALYGTEARDTDRTNSVTGLEYEITNVNVSWNYVTQTETNMKISYAVDNREGIIAPGGLIEGGIVIEYNGIEIANDRTYSANNLDGLKYDSITDTYMIPPYGRETVEQTVKIDNTKIVDAIKSHISVNNQSKLSIRSRLIKGFERNSIKIPRAGQAMSDCYITANLDGMSNQSCNFPSHKSSVKVVSNRYRTVPLSDFDRANDIPSVGSVSFVQDSTDMIEAKVSAYDSDGVITSYTWSHNGEEKEGEHVKLNQESKNEVYELTIVDDDDFEKVIEYNVSVSNGEVDYKVKQELFQLP